LNESETHRIGRGNDGFSRPPSRGQSKRFIARNAKHSPERASDF